MLVKAKKGEKEDMAVANRLHIYELFSQILGELCSQKYVFLFVFVSMCGGTSVHVRAECAHAHCSA